MKRTTIAVAVALVMVAAVAACAFVRHRRSRAASDFRASAFVSPASSGAVRASSGCGRAERSPATDAVQLGGRSYIVRPPAGYDTHRAYPLVVVLHGWHSSAADFAGWFTMERYVDGAAFVVYPEAAPGSGGTWDVVGARDLDAIDAMLDDVAARSCVDRARVLVFGFSYGGKLAHHLGCSRPASAKAIAVGDGSMAMREVGCGTIPVLVTHRTNDADERLAWGEDALATWRSGAGCSGGDDVVDLVHDCRTYRGCRAPVTFCEDHYVNPSWPDAWNHTVREEYRALTWEWFRSLN